MNRLAVLLVALAGSACASNRPLTLGEVYEWIPSEFLKARIELEWEAVSFNVRLHTTRRMGPIGLDLEGLLVLEDGSELKGIPRRLTPEWGSLGTFTGTVEIAFPMAASRSRPK